MFVQTTMNGTREEKMVLDVRALIEKARDKFLDDGDYIGAETEKAKRAGDERAVLKWSLLWQEIAMWIRIGHCVDFNELCDRRGFNPVQRKYLKDMMEYLELWGKTPTDVVMVSPAEIDRARKVMAIAFKNDPDFKQAYIANIAMLFKDRGWLKRPDQDRNVAAEAVLDLIFEDKR